MSANIVASKPKWITSSSFSRVLKEDLKEGSIVSVLKGGEKPEDAYGKVGDLIVDRLLLRYLSTC